MEFILLHEVYHVIYDHIARAHTKIKNPTQQEWNKCNICMDLEINRDIIAFFPEYGVINKKTPLTAGEATNSADDLNMIWWEDPRFYSKDNKPFSSEFYEVIYDNIKDNCADCLEDDSDINTPQPTITEEEEDDGRTALQNIYDEGYKYAIRKILDKEINPMGI